MNRVSPCKEWIDSVFYLARQKFSKTIISKIVHILCFIGLKLHDLDKVYKK